MTKPMSRKVNYPTGAWPTEMRAETAAAYCDEPSVELFLLKVKRGYYPKPFSEQGILPKWHRAKLEEAIAVRHGLVPAGGMLAENIAGLI